MKKLIIFLSILLASNAVHADYYYNGEYFTEDVPVEEVPVVGPVTEGIVEPVVEGAGTVVEGAARTAGDVVESAVELPGRVLGSIF